MKKYKSIILLFGCLCMASCSDFLDTESLSEQTGEVIYENEGMTRSAIMGIYSQLCDSYVYGQKMSVNWQGVSDIELAIKKILLLQGQIMVLLIIGVIGIWKIQNGKVFLKWQN